MGVQGVEPPASQKQPSDETCYRKGVQGEHPPADRETLA